MIKKEQDNFKKYTLMLFCTYYSLVQRIVKDNKNLQGLPLKVSLHWRICIIMNFFGDSKDKVIRKKIQRLSSTDTQ